MERVASTFLTIFMMYMVVDSQIIPVVRNIARVTFMDSLMSLILPIMTIYMLVFFLIFECIANAFAELTCFADRQFYSDWWNAVSYADFARDWNKPVHKFLLRHAYHESMNHLKVPHSYLAAEKRRNPIHVFAIIADARICLCCSLPESEALHVLVPDAPTALNLPIVSASHQET